MNNEKFKSEDNELYQLIYPNRLIIDLDFAWPQIKLRHVYYVKIEHLCINKNI